jgi:N6-L-threonylcarbamoyladenine synthase
MKKKFIAIETSCDETAVAVFEENRLLAHRISSQTDHAKFGGVIPELASRLHQQEIVRLFHQVLKESGVEEKAIQAIAVTQGPGLLGALWVGVSFAKAYAFAKNIPLIGVNHLEAHVLSHFIEAPFPEFPFMCLTVSGGHTQILKISSYLEMEIIGDTMDDAAGEAFDKAAKLLGMPYPGGPLLDKMAQSGNAEVYKFPAPDQKDLRFSFSGLKTSLLYFIRDQKLKDPDFVEHHLPDICASYQKAIVEGLIRNLQKAAVQNGIHQIALAGGVSANSGLRQAFKEMCLRNGWTGFTLPPTFCTDNAAMIGIAAWYKWQAGLVSDYHMMPKVR